MKRKIILSVGLIAFFGVILVKQAYRRQPFRWEEVPNQSEWKEYKIDEWGFKFKMPGVATLREWSLQAAPGKNVLGRGYELKQEGAPVMFWVLHYALPFDRNELREKRDELLDAIPNEQVAKFEGGLVYLRNHSLGTAPGREFQFKYQDGAHLHSAKNRLFFKDGRFFQIGVTTLQSRADSTFVNDFLDSFGWLEK